MAKSKGGSKGKEIIKELARDATKRTAAAVAPIAVAHAHVSQSAYVAPTAGVVAGLVAVLALALGAAVVDYRNRKTEIFIRNLIEGSGAETPEEVAAEVKRQIADPSAAAAVMDAANALESIVDEAVIPAIAALTRSYTMRKARPDRFFRRCLSVLRDIDASEIPAVLEIARLARNHPGTATQVQFMDRSVTPGAVSKYQVNEPQPHKMNTVWAEIPQGAMVADVLIQHGMARLLRSEEEGATFLMSRDYAARMVPVFSVTAVVVPGAVVEGTHPQS